jgi:hypothetical protein
MEMKKLIIALAISILSLLVITNINCGGSGGGSVKSKDETTTVTITIGEIKTAAEVEGGKVTTAQIPTYVTSMRFLISAPDMETIQRVTPVNGKTSITESFEVPSGDNRHITVDALNSTENVLYAAERDINLHGQHTTIDMDLAKESVPPVFNGLETVGSGTLTSLVLSWQPATDNVTPPEHIQYLIYMSETSGQDFNTPTYKTPLGATSYTVTGLSPNTTYYFVVRAMDEVGNIDTNIKEMSAVTGKTMTAIDVTKSCTDNRDVEGCILSIGITATVRNNGNETLKNISCFDNQISALSGVPPSLASGISATVTGTYDVPDCSTSLYTDTLTCSGTGETSNLTVSSAADSDTCNIITDMRIDKICELNYSGEEPPYRYYVEIYGRIFITGNENLINVTCNDSPPVSPAIPSFSELVAYGPYTLSQSIGDTGYTPTGSTPYSDTLTCTGTGKLSGRTITRQDNCCCEAYVYDPTLLSPTNGSTISNNSPTLAWNVVGSATSYEVHICSDAYCSSYPINTVRFKKNVYGTSWTVYPPLSSGQFWWRVRALNNNGCSGYWSSIWSFTIQ